MRPWLDCAESETESSKIVKMEPNTRAASMIRTRRNIHNVEPFIHPPLRPLSKNTTREHFMGESVASGGMDVNGFFCKFLKREQMGRLRAEKYWNFPQVGTEKDHFIGGKTGLTPYASLANLAGSRAHATM